jgi:Uma2 family endonuclease
LYSYADYLTWQFEEVVELIKGKIFKKAAAAPRRLHQKVSGELFLRLGNYLKGQKCQVYAAPFDVRFPKGSKEDNKIHDVVQPDICVICDPEKLDDRGCIGTPDLIVEIL